MPMQSSNELLTHELSDMYAAEQLIAKMLPTLASEAKDNQLKRALQHHETETKHQIENLNKAFLMFGSRPM